MVACLHYQRCHLITHACQLLLRLLWLQDCFRQILRRYLRLLHLLCSHPNHFGFCRLQIQTPGHVLCSFRETHLLWGYWEEAHWPVDLCKGRSPDPRPFTHLAPLLLLLLPYWDNLSSRQKKNSKKSQKVEEEKRQNRNRLWLILLNECQKETLGN